MDGTGPMVRVRVAGVALDSTEQHVVLLKPVDAPPGIGEVLPIWIGAQEATSILVALEDAPVPRPLAHDLMRSMLRALGATVERVEIPRLEGGTFFAEIMLSGGVVVDARPSDAIALASRCGASVYVARDVLDEAGVADMLAESDEEETVDEFHRFLEEVDPEDFRE
jgi:uncharacterized protein